MVSLLSRNRINIYHEWRLSEHFVPYHNEFCHSSYITAIVSFFFDKRELLLISKRSSVFVLSKLLSLDSPIHLFILFLYLLPSCLHLLTSFLIIFLSICNIYMLILLHISICSS